MYIIEIEELTKCFRVVKRRRGFLNTLRWLFSRGYEEIVAVDNISFHIKHGESVGIIGPNGSGKSTLIKLLCGVLVPTKGYVKVLGKTPTEHRYEIVQHIGVVYGQRSQLWWDLPLCDSFELIRYIYKIPPERYYKNLRNLTDLLDMKGFINTPVRQLSLGQRMRAEIVASLLHDPEILFLDEPTIGLDIVSKDRLREFIKYLNKHQGTTVFLSTHDLSDIEEISDTLLIIDRGKIIFNNNLSELRRKYGFYHTLIIDLKDAIEDIQIPNTTLLRRDGKRYYLSFDQSEISASRLISSIPPKYAVRNIMIEEPSIEDIIADIYNKGTIHK